MACIMGDCSTQSSLPSLPLLTTNVTRRTTLSPNRFEAMNLQHNHRRYFHFFLNGNQRSTTTQRSGNFIFEDSQQPNGNMQFQWFPEDANGTLYKLDDWFEFARNGFDIVANND